MQADIENFYRVVAQSPALMGKIFAGTTTPEDLIDRAVSVAKEEGYAITPQQASSWIDSQIAAKQNGELSDVQLEAVAGAGGLYPAQGFRRHI